MRLVQHKKEAYWFYRFLSIFYDNYVNPYFWTEAMRSEALELAKLDHPDLCTIDVGSGTGFTTQGIVAKVKPDSITCIDQSPHQMAKAKQKPELRGCTFQEGDAEDLPYPADHFDRYVSAGSIEYWPNPQRGIAEAYRILKPGGIALLIGPLRPKNRPGRFLADAWMLFPEEDDYLRWFRNAGFKDIQKRYVAPHWITREKYGLAISGRKEQPGESPAVAVPDNLEDPAEKMSPSRFMKFTFRLIIGSLAGFLFIPLALAGSVRQAFRRLFLNPPGSKSGNTEPPPLTRQQKISLLMVLVMVIVVMVWQLV